MDLHSCWNSHRTLLFFCICISFFFCLYCVFYCGPLLSLLFPPLLHSVGMILFWMLMKTYLAVSLVLFPVLDNNSCTGPFRIIPVLTFQTFLMCCSSGWTRCPTTHPNRQAALASCVSRTPTLALIPSRCHMVMCSSMLETSRSWVFPLRSRSSMTG